MRDQAVFREIAGTGDNPPEIPVVFVKAGNIDLCVQIAARVRANFQPAGLYVFDEFSRGCLDLKGIFRVFHFPGQGVAVDRAATLVRFKAQFALPRAVDERKAFLVGIQADENADFRDPRERFIKPEKTAGAKIAD